MVYGFYGVSVPALHPPPHSFPAVICPSCSLFSALLFRKLKYVCQQTAKTPLNMNRYCGVMNLKLNAVTAGHNFRLFNMLVGTVSLIR